MAKIKLEKVTGVVALSYVVLIPAAGAYLYMRLRLQEEDIQTIWEELKLPTDETTSRISLTNLRRILS